MPGDTYQSSQLGAALGSFFLVIVGISLISLIISIIAWWTIFSKAGYSGALSLLWFIPIANLVMFFVFAFGKWPILRELEMLRQQAAVWQQQAQYPQVQQMSSAPHYPPYQQGQQFSSGPQYPPYPQGQQPYAPHYPPYSHYPQR